MQLTSFDETDLLLPLYAGVHEQAKWMTFLERVRRRTAADYTSIIFAQGDTPIHLSKEVFAGRDLRAETRAAGLEDMYDVYRPSYNNLRPGRVYQITELISTDAKFRTFNEVFSSVMGISDARFLRIKEQEGTSAWLMLARNRGNFTAADGALLTAVAPHVAIALRSFVLVERQRIRGAASRDGLARAGVGWIALGRDARIIDFDPNLFPLLRQMNGSENPLGERLHVEHLHARQIVTQAAFEFAQTPDALPRVVTLTDDPRVDALLVPTTERPEAALAIAVLLAFCRFSHDSGVDRRPLLKDIYGLSPREAELALALSGGQSLIEAARNMRVTDETARSYTKAIYAKMGVRGQAELVRHIFLSSANLV